MEWFNSVSDVLTLIGVAILVLSGLWPWRGPRV